MHTLNTQTHTCNCDQLSKTLTILNNEWDAVSITFPVSSVLSHHCIFCIFLGVGSRSQVSLELSAVASPATDTENPTVDSSTKPTAGTSTR